MSVILIDSVFTIGKSCYPPVVLEECKHIVREKKLSRYVNDGLEIYSDDSDEEASDESDEN